MPHKDSENTELFLTSHYPLLDTHTKYQEYHPGLFICIISLKSYNCPIVQITAFLLEVIGAHQHD